MESGTHGTSRCWQSLNYQRERGRSDEMSASDYHMGLGAAEERRWGGDNMESFWVEPAGKKRKRFELSLSQKATRDVKLTTNPSLAI